MDQHSIKNILKLVSVIGIALGIFLMIPVAVGYYYGEAYYVFLLFDLAFLLLNASINLALQEHHIDLSLKEGILSVNLIWLLAGVAGAIPLFLYTDITFMQAFFEAISGFTTTGATVYHDIESLPKMILILRSLMHWMGGMGILVLGVGVFAFINPSGSLALFRAETTGVKFEKATPKIKDTAVRLWGIYFLLTLANVLMLKVEGMGVFDAVNHAFSTISTGGFSTKNSSMAAFDDPWILWTTTFFMMVSAINFLVHLKLFEGDLKGYRTEETRWFLTAFLVLSVALALVHGLSGDDMSVFHMITHASFTVAALLTTTGFVSIDYGQWGQAAIAICMLAMLVGGSGGSTAGGVKVIRLITAAKVIGLEIKKILHPTAVINMFIDRVPVAYTLVSAVFGFMMLFVGTNILISLFLYGCGYDALTSLTASIACVGNVGPGFGHVGPVENFGFFNDVEAGVLALGMILGRLEFYTFFLMLSPAFWKRF